MKLLLFANLACLLLAVPVYAEAKVCVGEPSHGQECWANGVHTICDVPVEDAIESIIEVPMDPAYLLTNEELTELAKILKADYNANIRVHIVKEPCLVKMEQAMREVDYYMDPKSKEPQRDILDALQTWANAKRECWNKP